MIRKTLLIGYASLLMFMVVSGMASAQTDGQQVVQPVDHNVGMQALAAAIAVGLAGIGAGIGEQAIGAAAIGAMAEDPKMFGKGLLMTIIPETIVIFGLVVSLIILFV